MENRASPESEAPLGGELKDTRRCLHYGIWSNPSISACITMASEARGLDGYLTSGQTHMVVPPRGEGDRQIATAGSCQN